MGPLNDNVFPIFVPVPDDDRSYYDFLDDQEDILSQFRNAQECKIREDLDSVCQLAMKVYIDMIGVNTYSKNTIETMKRITKDVLALREAMLDD